MRTACYYFLVLDIETSTYTEYDEEGTAIPRAVWLSYGYCNLYNYRGEREKVGYFREWIELEKILKDYSRMFVNNTLLCFVHNFGYEFDFLIKNLSLPKKMLSNSTHRIICSILEKFPNIEFRCTLQLSMQSLRKLGEQLGFEKLYSDYRTILPADTVTDEEKEYCCRDCDVVAKYVVSLIHEYGLLRAIPFTKTGRVRKTFNEFYKQTNPTWDYMPPEDCYTALCDAFAGGCVFSNPRYTARKVYGVHSYDITSSYPFVMLTELYPQNIKKVDDPNTEMLKRPFWIAKIKFNNIISRYHWQWLSMSKMNYFDPVSTEFYNGKLICSRYVTRTVTNVDYELICKTYTFDDLEVLEFYELDDGKPLPSPYIETIKIYAQKKSELKERVKADPDNLDLQREYTLAKGDFNSIYGMSVQKLMNSDYYIDELFQWQERDKPYKCTPGKHLRRNFLFGIFITAYARRNLINAILKNCPDTFVYCDTDSIKYIGEKPFIDTNKPLPTEYAAIPALSKLGRFDLDGEYDCFVTYGAKKYAYEKEGKLYLTVAGLPHYEAGKMKIEYKGQITDRLLSIEDFRPGTRFIACKHAHKYITCDYTFSVDDYGNVEGLKNVTDTALRFLKENKIQTNGGVVIFDADYSLEVTHTDRRVLQFYQKEWEREWNTIPGNEYCDTTFLIE